MSSFRIFCRRVLISRGILMIDEKKHLHCCNDGWQSKVCKLKAEGMWESDGHSRFDETG